MNCFNGSVFLFVKAVIHNFNDAGRIALVSKKRSNIDGGYIIIPKATIKCVQYKTLKAYSKAVYGAILTEFIRDNKLNPYNLVKIPHTQIEDISAETHGSVVRGVRELKDSGFIRVHGSGSFGGRTATFQLNGKYILTGVPPKAYW